MTKDAFSIPRPETGCDVAGHSRWCWGSRLVTFKRRSILILTGSQNKCALFLLRQFFRWSNKKHADAILHRSVDVCSSYRSFRFFPSPFIFQFYQASLAQQFDNQAITAANNRPVTNYRLQTFRFRTCYFSSNGIIGYERKKKKKKEIQCTEKQAFFCTFYKTSLKFSKNNQK